MTKTKAFTITELLVVLVISSIIFTLSILVFEFVEKQIQTKNRLDEFNNELFLIEKYLWKNFQNSTVTYSIKNKQLQFEKGFTEEKMIFHSDYILTQKDTIFISNYQVDCFWKGKKVELGEIDAFELKAVSPNNMKSSFFVFKRNGTDTVLNRFKWD